MSNLKLIHIYFWIFILPYSSHKFILFIKIPLVFFENGIFTLSTSSSSSIYKIAIAINTPTTMTTNLKLYAPKIDLHSFFFNYYELKTTSLSLSLHIHPKKPNILILKFLWLIEPLKLMIYGGSLLFEIMSAWRRLLCTKQVIS